MDKLCLFILIYLLHYATMCLTQMRVSKPKAHSTDKQAELTRCWYLRLGDLLTLGCSYQHLTYLITNRRLTNVKGEEEW